MQEREQKLALIYSYYILVETFNFKLCSCYNLYLAWVGLCMAPVHIDTVMGKTAFRGENTHWRERNTHWLL